MLLDYIHGRTSLSLISCLSLQPSPLSSALRTASFSLASTLDRLAASLSAHTSGARASDESRYFVDVKLHTEAMRDVLDVLQRVEGFGKGARGLGRSP
jgi:hypothetical protein